MTQPGQFSHPAFTRRFALQAGSIGLLGLGLNHLAALRETPASEPAASAAKQRACIFIFLSGGFAQHDTFDMKPNSPDNIRGEFQQISTATPDLFVSEHLPLLAQRSEKWSLIRSLAHPQNSHLHAHMMMLSGRTELPPAFNPNKAQPTDWPSILATGGDALRTYGPPPANNLPPAVMLPEGLRAVATEYLPGQGAGEMGDRRTPMEFALSPFRGERSWGAYPAYAFHHHTESAVEEKAAFEAPNLTLPEGFGEGRFNSRVDLLSYIERQRQDLDRAASGRSFDRARQGAISLLADERIRWALDATKADNKTQERYGKNSFGWSLLVAKRLVQCGVSLIQVNLGNYSTWDTHGANFRKLKDFLLPPTDLALSALLDDLEDEGLLDSTLVVTASEFGRSPKIFQCCPTVYKLPGRDHWGAAQTVLLAGGGIRGGAVIGATDNIGAFPTSHPLRPEDFAATIYHSLGIPKTGHWLDELGRPHQIYYGEPVTELM